ncbi:rap guanine nucleotide exchange factor 5-like isoform X2 [Antennarius striatus]|uniref:rap guanine nucleotide exchange factor 5-like isoform X2 n=1 Tax=Antennarius striatus TaxID=241820 RepID=UPI0035B06DBB
MGSRPQTLGLQEEGRLLHAALVEQEEDEDNDEGSDESSSDSTSRAEPVTMLTFDVPYFRYIDDEGTEGEEEWSSSRSLSSIEEDLSTDSVVSDRYMVVSGTPEKILEHLLNDLTLDDDQGTTQGKEPDTLLDDFLLTYPVFMSTSDLCQALLGHYCTKRYRGKEDRKEALERKRKVLHLVSQWVALCKDFLRNDDHVKLFLKTLYRFVLDDIYEHPALENDGRELQKLYQLHHRHALDEYSPHRKRKVLFHQLSLKETGLHVRGTQRETREVLCHVYITMDSYLSMRAHAGVVAQDLLQAVADRMDVPRGELELVAVTYPGGRLLLQPQDRLFSDSLRMVGRLHVCRKELGEILNPFTDNSELQHRTARMLSLNTWDVAVALTNFDWTIFDSINEQELVYFTFSRHSCSSYTVALELLLQRCNEVQLWVMTEVLLCPTLCKRVQLIKKFIKIAAHCKAQRNLNCFFAIILGLNTAAVSRLNQTWEKIPGKFKKILSELEAITDPSLNHKAYRDSFKKMKAPKIPFLPLLLKDMTFIHEGNKTFHDNVVNFEKLEMVTLRRAVQRCELTLTTFLSSTIRRLCLNCHTDWSLGFDRTSLNAQTFGLTRSNLSIDLSLRTINDHQRALLNQENPNYRLGTNSKELIIDQIRMIQNHPTHKLSSSYTQNYATNRQEQTPAAGFR